MKGVLDLRGNPILLITTKQDYDWAVKHGVTLEDIECPVCKIKSKRQPWEKDNEQKT